jgi:hypothetical protein
MEPRKILLRRRQSHILRLIYFLWFPMKQIFSIGRMHDVPSLNFWFNLSEIYCIGLVLKLVAVRSSSRASQLSLRNYMFEFVWADVGCSLSEQHLSIFSDRLLPDPFRCHMQISLELQTQQATSLTYFDNILVYFYNYELLTIHRHVSNTR